MIQGTAWVVAGTQTGTHNYLILFGDIQIIQRLLIGITSEEIHIPDTDIVHIVEGVATRTTYADNCYY